MIITVHKITAEMLGDPHLGRSFIHGVPLDRRGEREEMVWAQFEQSLSNTQANIHICLGDLFDKAVVSYHIIARAAELYIRAATQKPNTTYVILKGNHDWMRDLERPSAFDLFAMMVRSIDNIKVVTDWMSLGPYSLFAWHPTISADDMVTKMQKELGHIGQVSIGHWDVESFGGSDSNLIPTKQLTNLGIKTAYTGHVHKPQQFKRDGVDVTVVGSMQPYAFGEQLNDDLYVELTKQDLDGQDLHNKCVRVLLEADEILDEEVDCLQLTFKKASADGEDDTPSVSLGSFDMEELFRKAFKDSGVSDEITTSLLDKFNSQRLTADA